MKMKQELEMYQHTNRVQAEEIGRLKDALKGIRSICRDGTMLEFVKLLEIYEQTGVLDRRATLISDLRSGRKS